MHEITEDAPLFQLFWENSSLTPSRALVLREAIATDAAQAYQAYRPRHATATMFLPASASSLEKIWSKRRSRRTFSDRPLTAQQLSNIFRPFAVMPDGRHALSSGGGKYPMQIYAALLKVRLGEAVSGKLVWYNPDEHGMVPIGIAPDWLDLARIIGVDWDTAPAVVFFLVARSESLTAKYGERGGRFMLLEAGAHMLALDMETTAQGLAGVSVGAFMDAQVLDLLGLSSQKHQAVLCYACGVT